MVTCDKNMRDAIFLKRNDDVFTVRMTDKGW